MWETIFRGLFETGPVSSLAVGKFFACILCALILGLILALTYMYHTVYSKSFVVTLALLPAVVCVVIMMVNGNIGVGVAVAGAFSLVRFRSVPGTAREIGVLFCAMGAGLVVGMGYLAYGVLFTLVLCIVLLLYNKFRFGEKEIGALDKTLRITIPEDLDYTDVFEEIFPEYAVRWELTQVKTTNMGSLFKLTYNLTLRSREAEKPLIDQLRCRNGNLEISMSKRELATSGM